MDLWYAFVKYFIGFAELIQVLLDFWANWHIVANAGKKNALGLLQKKVVFEFQNSSNEGR